MKPKNKFSFLKNAIWLFLIIMQSHNIKSQQINNYDCGTWQIDSIYYTDWKTTDTIKYNPNGDTTWIYSVWSSELINVEAGVYCPCGCGFDTEKFQDRVSRLGIIQRRYEITSYKYVQKQPSNFDNCINELKLINYENK